MYNKKQLLVSIYKKRIFDLDFDVGVSKNPFYTSNVSIGDILAKSYYSFYGGVFSNFYRSPFILEGIKYSSVEKYMMAKKAKLFNDEETYKKIMSNHNPKIIKRLGRKVSNFNQEVWDENKISIVYEGCLAKFTQNPKLRETLVKFGYMCILVEASPVDIVWGVGMHISDPDIHNPEKWRGENLLGFILTDIKNNLISDKTK